MKNKTKYNILTLIFCAAVFVVAVAMIIAYRLYGVRAALLTFAAECATVAMSLAAYLQDELPDDEAPKEEPEQYETRKLKCADCGEIFKCYGAALQISDLNRRGRPIGRLEIPRGDFNLIAVNVSEEDKQEFQKLRRCPLCGGELKEEREDSTHDRPAV